MHKLFISGLALSLAVQTAGAADLGQQQAQSFAQLYAALCMKNLPDLEALRTQLKPVPRLPADQAKHFLAGRPGDAWPVPDKTGTFVLALPTGKNFCALHLRRTDTAATKRLFIQMVGKPSAPVTAKKVLDEKKQTASNGQTETIAYEWSRPNATHKILFTLTTAAAPTAQLQALGSVAIISK